MKPRVTLRLIKMEQTRISSINSKYTSFTEPFNLLEIEMTGIPQTVRNTYSLEFLFNDKKKSEKYR